MDLFLKGLGCVAVLLVIGVIFFIFKLRQFSKQLSSSVSPAEIHVHSTTEDKWSDKKTRDETVAALSSKGFINLGMYRIDEMPLIPVMAMSHGENRLLAVLYEHPKLGIWMDFVVKYPGDKSLTVSNASMGGQLEHRPNHDKEYMPKVSMADLYTKVIALSSGKEKEPVPTDNAGFIEAMQNSYRDDMLWRSSRGGVNAEELRRLAESSGQKVNDEIIQSALEIEQGKAYSRLASQLIPRLEAEGIIPSSRSEDFDSSLVFVHDQMGKETLGEILNRFGFPAISSSESLRESFASWNSSLSPETRFQKLGALKTPVEIDVYRSRTAML